LELDGKLSSFILILSSRATVTLTCLGWTKTAFAATLLRLTDGVTKSFVWFILVFTNITTIISAAVPWMQCDPLAKTWDPALPGSCWAPKVGTKIWIGMGGSSILFPSLVRSQVRESHTLTLLLQHTPPL